jgi:hypothetical protein
MRAAARGRRSAAGFPARPAPQPFPCQHLLDPISPPWLLQTDARSMQHHETTPRRARSPRPLHAEVPRPLGRAAGRQAAAAGARSRPACCHPLHVCAGPALLLSPLMPWHRPRRIIHARFGPIHARRPARPIAAFASSPPAARPRRVPGAVPHSSVFAGLQGACGRRGRGPDARHRSRPVPALCRPSADNGSLRASPSRFPTLVPASASMRGEAPPPRPGGRGRGAPTPFPPFWASATWPGPSASLKRQGAARMYVCQQYVGRRRPFHPLP